MKKHFLPLILGLAGVFAIATAFGTGDEPLDEPEDDGVVLGEEDLAERGEILRNQFRRMTPSDEPLLQDVGTWPAAWEEFGTNWDSATADREYGAWVVPVELTQENGATVMKDGEGNELWRGTTDFARPESADVVLTGGLVAEEDWTVYEAVRGAVEEMTADASRVDLPVPMRSHPTNGLRFTSCAWTTNDSFHMELAYEVDTNVDLFVYAVAHTSALVVATWTNDENVAVTDTNTVWYPVGEPFNGRDSTWEYLDTVAIDNGVAEYEDSGFPAGLGRLRYYAAAVAQDSDGDGLSDGQEAFISHTDPEDDDSDHDGIDDPTELAAGTNPSGSNVWWVTTTTNYIHEWVYLGTNIPSVPQQITNYWIVATNRPTTNSVVHDIKVTGHVDDILTIDGDTHVVGGWDNGPTNFTAQSILAQTTNAQSGRVNLVLWDLPAAGYTNENEVKIGSSQENPFRVEWEWRVPMDFRLEHVTTDRNPLVVNPSGTRTNHNFSCKATVLPTNISESAICWSCTNAGMSFVGGVTNGRTVQLTASQLGDWDATVTVQDSTLGDVQLHGTVLQKKTVPICLHIVREDNGSGAATTVEAFQNLLVGANQLYEQSAIEFQVTNVVYIDNSAWLDISESNDWAEYRQLQAYNIHTGGLEIYCVRSLAGDLPGLSYVWPDASSGLTIANTATSETLAHELGHACGLCDIYVDWPPDNPYLEVPRFPVEQSWEQEDWCGELSDGGYGDLTQPDLSRRLLMYGIDIAGAVDIPSGPIRGINENGVQTHVAVGLSGMGNRQPVHW